MTDAISATEQTTLPVADAPVNVEPVPDTPLNTDVLQSCTARMTHQCWKTYLTCKKEPARLKTSPLRINLTARSEAGLNELVQTLEDAGVRQKSRLGKTILEMTATFAQLQTVIRHPETHLVDAIALA